MLSASMESGLLVKRIKEFAQGACTFDEVEALAFDIRDRWSRASATELPPESASETALWNAVWTITASCRESLASNDTSPHPVLDLIRYLDGSVPLPRGTLAQRP